MPMIKIPIFNEMPIEEIAWIAGFVDGEGSICIYKRPKKDGQNFSLRVTVSNTNKVVLEWLKLNFGGCIIVDRKQRQTDKNAKIGYIWHLSTGRAIAFITLIKPHLKVKKLQADLALQFYETILERGKRFYGDEHEYLRRQKIYYDMKKLNKRGLRDHKKVS